MSDPARFRHLREPKFPVPEPPGPVGDLRDLARSRTISLNLEIVGDRARSSEIAEVILRSKRLENWKIQLMEITTQPGIIANSPGARPQPPVAC